MQKADRIFSKLYAIFGAFVVICFGSYFIKLIISSEGTLPWIATTSALTAVLVPYFFRVPLRRILKKAYVPLKGVMSAGMILYAATFVALVGYIYLAPVADVDSIDPNTQRVYIVFGARVKAEGPTATLAARLDEAVYAMEKDESAVCIVSGGQGPNEPMPEGECMRDYMVSRGIPEERIIVEDKAKNTLQNIKFSTDLMEKHGLSDRDVICISSDTHIPRIRLMCEREGVTAEYIKAESPKKEFLFTTWVREHLSYAKMLIMGG